MATVPLWVTGHSLVFMEAVVQTLNTSTGALADSTSTDIATLANDGSVTGAAGSSAVFGVVDSVELNSTRTTENIAGCAQYFGNAVRLTRKDSLTVTEVLRTPVGTSLLAAIWYSNTSRYVRVTFKRGHSSWTFYGIMESYQESLRHGKSTGSMSIQMIDVGQNNAAFTA
jgi:hypothetical protein